MPPIAAPAAAATKTWMYPLRHKGFEAWNEWEERESNAMERPPGIEQYSRLIDS
jgi:hypothetical protein